MGHSLALNLLHCFPQKVVRKATVHRSPLLFDALTKLSSGSLSHLTSTHNGCLVDFEDIPVLREYVWIPPGQRLHVGPGRLAVDNYGCGQGAGGRFFPIFLGGPAPPEWRGRAGGSLMLGAERAVRRKNAPLGARVFSALGLGAWALGRLGLGLAPRDVYL